MEREPDDESLLGAFSARGRRAPLAKEAAVLRRDLALVHTDAIAASIMVGTGETYIAAFALALGLGDIVAGYAASGPFLAGAVLQLVSPWGVRRLGSHRRWVVLCALLQAASFIPLCAAALHGSLSALGLLLIATFYWATGMATGPAWSTWVGTLDPAQHALAVLRAAHPRAPRSRCCSGCSRAGRSCTSASTGGSTCTRSRRCSRRRVSRAPGRRGCSRTRASRTRWSRPRRSRTAWPGRRAWPGTGA